ncbi:hypothetical protein [Streptomyces sp. NBC_01092]|uniref:hypothetical protein n=1 Tax=Streptomyces sp. NBC_01092 TaxID=2903748 RepID=UPI00386D1F6A|nr:hypothetical protein OG254_14740 [Streptomyces sp. NBC_01092]
MGSRPTTVGGQRVEELLEAASVSVSELTGAVGGFEGDAVSMVRSSIHTAARVFAELDACDAVIDKAAESGADSADRLRAALAAETVAPAAAELASLDAMIEDVRRCDEPRRLLNRLLGRDESDILERTPVARLTAAELPEIPSSYGDGAYADLMAMADREAELAPRLAAAHAERITRVRTHLVAVVRQAVRTGFADAAFTRESVEEAHGAFELWQRCLRERHRSLG